jgi:hypothetical protein
MRGDIDLLQDLPFDCIFVDECHIAKEVQSKTYQALKSFACTTRFGMTVGSLCLFPLDNLTPPRRAQRFRTSTKSFGRSSTLLFPAN